MQVKKRRSKSWANDSIYTYSMLGDSIAAGTSLRRRRRSESVLQNQKPRGECRARDRSSRRLQARQCTREAWLIGHTHRLVQPPPLFRSLALSCSLPIRRARQVELDIDYFTYKLDIFFLFIFFFYSFWIINFFFFTFVCLQESLSDKVAMFDQHANKHINSQAKNPFSSGLNLPKPTFSKEEYGR